MRKNALIIAVLSASVMVGSSIGWAQHQTGQENVIRPATSPQERQEMMQQHHRMMREQGEMMQQMGKMMQRQGEMMQRHARMMQECPMMQPGSMKQQSN